MAYCVYILYSPSIDQYYVGHTEDLVDRLYRHTHSGSRSTKQTNDWRVVYTEPFATRAEAVQRELQIKKKKSRRYIESLLTRTG